MKKILTICILLFVFSIALTACGKCEHSYSNGCDASCNECGEERAITHSFKAANCTEAKTCSVCGKTEGEALGHTPESDDGDCTTDIKCANCGAVTTVGNASHTPESDDGDCTTAVKCGECDKTAIEAKAAHTPEADDGDCTTDIKCASCDTVTTEGNAAHTPESDDGDCTTAVKCDVCDKTAIEAKAAHVPEVDDYDCTTPLTCESCDYIFAEADSHDFETFLSADTVAHWYKCQNEGCNAKDKYAEHTPEEDDGNCATSIPCEVCGWTLIDGTEHTPAEDDGDCTTAVDCLVCDTNAVEARVAHTDGDLDGVCDFCIQDARVEYTVSLDRQQEGVEIVLENYLGTHKALTDENGVATLKLPGGEYRLTVKHYNSAHVWVDRDNSVTLSPNNPTHLARFEILGDEEFIEYSIFLYNSDGSLCIDATVFTFAMSGEVDSLFITNSVGNAVTYAYHRNYTVTIYSPEGDRYYVTEFKKNGPTTLHITLEDNTPALTEENPMVIHELEKLPYYDDYVATLPLDNSYELKAGEPIYLLVPYARGKIVSFGSDKLIVEYGGEVRQLNSDGTLTLDAAYGEAVVLKVTATESFTEEIAVSHPGTEQEPIYLTGSKLNDYSLVYDFAEGESLYFEIVANANMQLEVLAEGQHITINGEETSTVVTSPNYYIVCITAKVAGEVDIGFSYTQIPNT